MKNPISSSPTSVALQAGHTNAPPALDLSSVKDETSRWPVIPPSAKSLRTRNPIREIVDPIVASLESSGARDDGKGHISLAVSVTQTL